MTDPKHPKGYDLSDFCEENPTASLEDLIENDAAYNGEEEAPTPPPPKAEDPRRMQIKRLESKMMWTKGNRNNPGVPKRTMYNMNLVFSEHPDWKDALRYNEREMFIYLMPENPVIPKLKKPQLIRDCDFSMAYMWLEQNYPTIAEEGKCKRALVAAAEIHNSYDPLKDYFQALEWDGEARLDTWLYDYAGCEDTQYVQAVGAKFLISAVARTYRPGCKADAMLILRGDQGIGKSTVLKELASEEFFTDHLSSMTEKDARLELQGPLIIEIAELDSLKKSENSSAKSFIATTHDRFRAPYSAVVMKVARRCVFAASTNEDKFLKDSTGGRRFWPVLCTRTDREGVRAARDQLWAEAVHRYKNGEQWWLTDNQETLAKKQQFDHTVSDPWETKVIDHCMLPFSDETIKQKFSKMFHRGQRIYISTMEIEEQLGDVARRDKYAKKRINDIFRKMGFQSHKGRVRIDGCQARLWGIPMEFFTEYSESPELNKNENPADDPPNY
jgi:hypothetical protein